MHLKMSGHENLYPELEKVIPGALGALVSLRWIDGTVYQRIGAVLGGAGTSYYGLDFVGRTWPSIQGGFAGWLLGMFGMAVAHAIVKGIETFDVASRINKVFAKWGL